MNTEGNKRSSKARSGDKASSAGVVKSRSKKKETPDYGDLDKEFRNYLANQKLAVVAVRNKTSFRDSVQDHLLMVDVIKKGITYSLFEEILKLSSLTLRDWADILNVSIRSLQRYKDQNQRFKPIQSEKIIELGEIFLLGNEVFGDEQKFKSWLDTPSFALGTKKPSDLLGDTYGQELVKNELIRISHGIFA